MHTRNGTAASRLRHCPFAPERISRKVVAPHQPVTPMVLRIRREAILEQLREAFTYGLQPPDALYRVFTQEFGSGHTRTEYLVYLHYASPLARELAMDKGWAASMLWNRSGLRQLVQGLSEDHPDTLRMADMFFCGTCSAWVIAGLWRSAAAGSFGTDTLVLPVTRPTPAELANAKRLRRRSLRRVVKSLRLIQKMARMFADEAPI